MGAFKRLSRIFESAGQISFDNSSRIIIMSDCHRGDGSWADGFLKNRHLYMHALNYYYNNNYIYIELGDGDELWENGNLSCIMEIHRDVFEILSRFLCRGCFYSVYGNHDMVKKNNKYLKKNFAAFFAGGYRGRIAVFENIKVHEGLVLKHADTGNKIFMIHGHQADYFNYGLWKLAGFLVRYFWKPLELFGVNDPTDAAKNYQIKESVEKKLTRWVIANEQAIIAGHTHRSAFPQKGEPLYFNAGSCVHPYGITGIEIADGSVSLVKWEVKTKTDGTLFAGREILAGPRKLEECFKSKAIKRSIRN